MFSCSWIFCIFLIQIKIDLEWNVLDLYGHTSDFVSKSQRKGYLSKYNIGIFKMKAFVIKAEIDRFVIHLVTIT